MTKRLLLFSYFFPPLGGAGVQRALKLCRAAPDLGWHVSVVACAPAAGDSLDLSMVAEVPDDLEVVRTGALRLHRLGAWANRWLTPDPYLGWLPEAGDAARDLCRQRPFDAVMSTSMPYTAHLAAMEIKRDFQIPWLCDLRDPWTDNRFMHHYRSPAPHGLWRRWIDRRLERAVYRHADLVSVTTEPLRQLLIDRHGLDPDRVWTARNGYDEADFASALPMPGLASHRQPPGQDAVMTLLFAGSMYQGYTLAPLFAAWQALLTRRPEVRLRLVMYSDNVGILRGLLAEFPAVAPFVTQGPRVSHAEVVARYATGDLLVLSALDDLSTPGKLFEFIRSGTAVLAFAVQGAEARALLDRTGTGCCAPADDPEAGARTLEGLYDQWRAGQPLSAPRAAEVAALERTGAYRTLLAALDARVARR
ncbi:MAG: glycosyltransferase [Deltaproteobacteria bacterium]|nr:glycosyltransferase [Deltaproteobacteria bacterium]